MRTESGRSNRKTLVIVGPTGSGKTGVAIEIALKLGGEVISADSRAIYRGMDIGTAKPSLEEMRGVRHFGIDLVEPGERFTVVDFQEYCRETVADIRARGKLPMVVGGTGLYVDAVIYGYSFTDIVKKTCSDRTEMDSDFVVIGVKWERDELRARLTERANKLFAQGIVDETKRLVKKYGWDNQAMKSNIYPIVWRMINGEISEEEAKALFVFDDWHLAKRQMTWLKRNKKIIWLRLDEIEDYVYNLYR
ncbi:tRNA (adenosine(37)-N6)-dimethylallyltransferase MiaA [Candidatus Saccharibacteria bacterium]|nr:tRNA (adenosine(37)-N6)-dimethylallyltransferase MiaA [Candidatus Saccharibacteria bacterium]